MPSSGSAELRALAARLRAEGEGAMLRQMAAAMRAAGKPLTEAAKRKAEAELPKGGGLNVYVANQRLTVSVLTSARSAGVRIVSRVPVAGQTNQGFARHPTFGRRGKGDWKTTETKAATGWFDDTMRESGPLVTPLLLAEMRRVAAEIGGI